MKKIQSFQNIFRVKKIVAYDIKRPIACKANPYIGGSKKRRNKQYDSSFVLRTFC